MNTLLTVSLRQKAVYVPEANIVNKHGVLTETTGLLVANLSKLGFGVSETLLKALNSTTPAFQVSVLNSLREVAGVNKNWTPLVKGWDVPTGETVVDHIMTFFANIFQARGTKLQCGHIIPAGTFPLERYNGCPFCGTPFESGAIEHYKQGSEMKVLELWTLNDASQFLNDLLTSKTALDATQIDSLKILLGEFPIPDVKIGMKETLMAVIDIYISQNKPEKAQALFTAPTDVLRYLWYKHTGFLQIVEPSTIVNRKSKNSKHISLILDRSAGAKLTAKAALKLKYSRKECLMVAKWLNEMNIDSGKMCEMMHPKRGMWVRFIRALRLAEYSKREGFEKLRDLLDKFYKEDYQVWQGDVNFYRLRYDAAKTFALLKQRPGLFARSLFANMLWFGKDATVAAFAEVIDQVPARLVFTLNMYAENYFSKEARVVKPLGGVNKNIPANYLLTMYDDEQLDAMKGAVADLCMIAMEKRFAAAKTESKTIYIDPMLFKIPVSIGDRSETVQDLPGALMGTRFDVQGDVVRLFMQWGNGLPAQHMDMDLSCMIAYPGGGAEGCAFHNLVTTGCKHSGDIQRIPDKIGTAEYIEVNLVELKKAGAKYVSFTCNAYSRGSITPNLVVGWMNSKYPMTISATTGVAYDPSCVQHQVRVVNSLSKGLLFGVLDVEKSELVWLEMQFSGQLVQNLNLCNVQALLKKLDSKLTIGQLLRLKADAQGLTIVENDEADEVYDTAWASNTAAVTKLLID